MTDVSEAVVKDLPQEDKDSLPLPISENSELDLSVLDTLNLSENTQKQDSTSSTPALGLKAINQKGDIVFLMAEGIGFHKSLPEIYIPNSILDFKYKLNTYSIEHPNEELHIISYYGASENIETPNLGMQRGNKVKEVLINTGIPAEKIVIKPTIMELQFDENENYQQGISFIFRPLDKDRLKSLQFSLPENKTIYPNFVNNDIFVNDALKDLLQEAKSTFAMHPQVVIEIIGHTDNVGNANDNYLVALRYARQVRWYLVTKGGIPKDQVIASSQGEAMAIANNATERGRFLNRRIEVHYRLN